jgi:hypothetical protein
VLFQSSFYEPDRLFTSANFAETLGFNKGELLPFALLLNYAVGMSHVDDTKVVLDLGFENAVYVQAAHAGQTFSKTFTIKRIRQTSNGKHTILTIKCDLINTKTKAVVFTVDKIMLFKGVTNAAAESREPEIKKQVSQSMLLEHIKSNSLELPQNMILAPIQPGELLLHGSARPIGKSNNMALSSLFRMTHPMIFNVHKYGQDNLVVPGALVLSAAMSSASRDIFEVLYHEILNCSFLNKVSPVDTIGSMSYVHSITSIPGSSLEEVILTTVGVKNCSVVDELDKKELPPALFQENLLPNDLEDMLEQDFPLLAGKIVCITKRKVIRQSHFEGDFFMPLL